MPETFLDAYIKHTSIYESPTSFWKWSAYATISAVLRDKCYLLSGGDHHTFPNLYIMLLAESSGHRKNKPVETSQNLVINLSLEMTKTNDSIKTISGRASVQGILDELAKGETSGNTGRVLRSKAATFYAPELSAGIVSDPQGLKTLTDIYDYKINPYQHLLRTGPSFDLEGVVFSMFMASNQDMLQGMFDQAVIRGGFLARTLLVIPDEFRPGNTLMDLDEEERKASKIRVMDRLKDIYRLGGKFLIEPSAKEEYKLWYVPFRAEYAKLKEETGIIGRIHTHIVKLALILAANELVLCVRKKHIEQAIEECLGLLKNYGLFTMNHAKSEIGTVGGTIILTLLEAPSCMLSRKMLMRNHWRDFDAEMLDKAVLALEEAGFIKTHQTREGLAYQLTAECVKRFQGEDHKG